jgi:hypothetical protein
LLIEQKEFPIQTDFLMQESFEEKDTPPPLIFQISTEKQCSDET